MHPDAAGWTTTPARRDDAVAAAVAVTLLQKQ